MFGLHFVNTGKIEKEFLKKGIWFLENIQGLTMISYNLWKNKSPEAAKLLRQVEKKPGYCHRGGNYSLWLSSSGISQPIFRLGFSDHH